jgi:Zn-dependent protease
MSLIIKIFIELPILLMTLTVHEFSHGWVAYMLGDDTAKRMGRLTLNPISHIDPIGMIMLFLVHIGWAKPVPINPYNFKDQKRDMALSAAAGPLSNFIVAIIFSLFFRIITHGNPQMMMYGSLSAQIVIYIIYYTVLINLALGIFNLIPIPPMDGSKILGGFLSDEAYYKYTLQEQRGAQILMIIFLISYIFRLNLIGTIITPPLNFCLRILMGVTL